MKFVTLQIQKLITSAVAQLDLSRSRYGRIVFTLGITHYSCVMYLTSLFCQSGAWKEQAAKQGEICGFSSNDSVYGYINIYPCKEHDPRISCPDAFTRVLVFQSDSNYLYSCVRFS